MAGFQIPTKLKLGARLLYGLLEKEKMRKITFPFVMCVLISGCANLVTPNPGDRTTPRLNLGFYFGTETSSQSVWLPAAISGENLEERCIHVPSPFRVTATAIDDGGIRKIILEPYYSSDEIYARDLDGDITARFTPTQRMLRSGDRSFSNPGRHPITDNVVVDYEDGPFYDRGWVSGVFEFLPGAVQSAFQARAYNFSTHGRDSGWSTIADYWVKPATSDFPPGSPCTPSIVPF